jgi:excisionase family DNA binding protein
MGNDAEITAAEAAKILGVTATNVRWYHRQGLLPGRRVGGLLLMFRREDVEQFVKPKKSGRPKASRKAPATGVAIPKKGRPRKPSPDAAAAPDAAAGPAAAPSEAKPGGKPSRARAKRKRD